MSESNAGALHEMNPLQRFSDRAADYSKYRPSYPETALACIFEGLGEPARLIAADIGAGTGISARLLASKGARVIAIEPNAEMRQAAQPHPLVEWRSGSAEATTLPDKAVDLVTCFQAFHWFEPERSLLEFRRIFKKSGRLVLVWNDRDKSDEFTAEYSRLVRKASNNHPAEAKISAVEPLFASPHFADIRECGFEYRQELDLTGLIGRAQSVSYVPREGEELQQLLADLTELHEKWRDERGAVYLAYHTKVYLAVPAIREK